MEALGEIELDEVEQHPGSQAEERLRDEKASEPATIHLQELPDGNHLARPQIRAPGKLDEQPQAHRLEQRHRDKGRPQRNQRGGRTRAEPSRQLRRITANQEAYDAGHPGEGVAGRVQRDPLVRPAELGQDG